MIIISGGDDAKMREIIENALTEAGESFILTDDESDIISTEQAVALMVYNASKIRTYLGRLERNTRKQEEDLRKQENHMEIMTLLLEPLSVYFEDKLPDDVSPAPRRTDLTSRLTEVRLTRRRRQQDARRREEAEARGTEESS